MLQMREKCERCGYNLPNGSHEAMICSLECTFCSHCNTNALKGVSELRRRTWQVPYASIQEGAMTTELTPRSGSYSPV